METIMNKTKNEKTIFLKIKNIDTDVEWEKLVNERRKRKEKFLREVQI